MNNDTQFPKQLVKQFNHLNKYNDITKLIIIFFL